MKEFLDAYLGDLPMPVGTNDAIASFDIAMAVRESYKSGRKVIL
jgi:predicted dehydrogenase